MGLESNKQRILVAAALLLAAGLFSRGRHTRWPPVRQRGHWPIQTLDYRAEDWLVLDSIFSQVLSPYNLQHGTSLLAPCAAEVEQVG
jgi:hypothetical protein